MSDLKRIETLVQKSIDTQNTFHGEVREHMGAATAFQARMLDFKEDSTEAHETLRVKHEGLSRRVSWIIGIGTALVFAVSTALAIAATL